MGSSHGVGPEHEAYAMGCHCGTCRPGAAVKPLTYDETSAKAIEQSRFAGQKEASMRTDGLQFVPPILREQYEAWIKASRKRARRERIVRRVAYAALGIGVVLALFGLMVAVSHGAPVEPHTGDRARQGQAVEQPKVERGGLVEAQTKCEQVHGEWFVDDKSEGLPPGAKVVGCFWIVPKDMK